jgi:hypothetical protein
MHPLAFERTVSIDGFTLGSDPGLLLPSFVALAARAWRSAASDVRLSGLGWTETLVLLHPLEATRWAVAGRWAPAALSARPAPVGLGGPVVVDGGDAAVSSPRGAWRASGLIGAPLLARRLAVALSVEATGVSFPPVEPEFAAGGLARQALALTTTWLPTGSDRLDLLVLAGRRTESPDCFRCTESAARVDQTLGAFIGLSWAHGLGPAAALELRLSGEHHRGSAGARSPTSAPSHLDLMTWMTDGAPGPLAPDLDASTLDAAWTRLHLATALHGEIAGQRLEAGVEGRLETGWSAFSTPGGLRFVDRGSACSEEDRSGCAFRVDIVPTNVQTRAVALAAYVEDVLHLGHLHFRAGARLETIQAGAEEASTGLRMGIGPRLLLAWDVEGSGRHWLQLHAGRSHDTEAQPWFVRSVLPAERVASRIGTAFDDCARAGPSCVHLGGPAGIAPGGLPRTDEVALGWRGLPTRGLEAGFEARWRRTTDLWTATETGLLGDQRGRWTSTDDLWTSRRVLSADPRAWRQALGLGAWARVQVGPALVAVTWSVSRVTGTAAGPFDPWLADPRTAALAAGPLPDDRRHRLTLSFAFLAHRAVELGARLRYASGTPLWETFSVPDSMGLRTVQGTRGTGVLGSASVLLRDPDALAADAWLRLRLGTLVPDLLPRLDLTLEAAQVAGGNTPVHLSASSTRLGAVLRREAPFQLVFGLRAGD